MENNIFDPLKYFEELAKSNRLCIENKFLPCFCSGPDSIQGVMENYRTTSNFIMIDDTTDSNTTSNKVGWFKKDVYTVFILAGYKYDDMTDREEKLSLCRKIFRQLMSKVIQDRANLAYDDQLIYLELTNVYSKELGRYSMNGVTGLYFMIGNDVPTDLTYKSEEWE